MNKTATPRAAAEAPDAGAPGGSRSREGRPAGAFGVAAPLLAACIAALLLAGCAAAPVTHLHSLQPAVPPQRLPDAAAPGALVVQIDLPLLPRQLDQPQWLVRRADDSLVALEHERWSTALPDELRAALAEALAQRYGVTDARAIAGTPSPAARLSLQVLRLESWPGREVQWDALWSLANTGGTPLTCRATLRVSAAPGYPALAAAHREALAQLADQIGPRLRRDAVAGCPPS